MAMGYARLCAIFLYVSQYTVTSLNGYCSLEQRCRPRPIHRARSFLCMGGATGYATTLEGKMKKVETVKGLLESSAMIFSVPGESLTVKQATILRRSLPESTTMSVVKNKLMSRALEGTEYEEAGKGLLTGSNMWFFIEEDIGGTIKAFNKFTKDEGKKDSHVVNGGVMEGTLFDAAGVEAISKLPSKTELLAQIAGSVKAIPTKVARVIKAPGNKLARAIKLATVDDDSDSS